MNVTISPGPLCGEVIIPSSKSFTHRLLIAAALSDGPTQVHTNVFSKDILATASCLSALGAALEKTPWGYQVWPISERPSSPCNLHCIESGSTLRFMIPVAAALGLDCVFTGEGRLPQRPNAELTQALRSHGVEADNDFLPLKIHGQLEGGLFRIAGNISSQYITALLLSLPLCSKDSQILLTSPLESASYVNITLEVLKTFGICIERTPDGFLIPGSQRYRSPGTVHAEGDWSSAAFWKCANKLGHQVRCLNLPEASFQGDRAIESFLENLGGDIDVSDTPDLAPALCIAAAAHPGKTRISGASRLRLKESDRLAAMSRMLRALGCPCVEGEDFLLIEGGRPFASCQIDGCNDHRIVMAAAIAASVAQGPITITDKEASAKSYPSFFEDFAALGGLVHVESDR